MDDFDNFPNFDLGDLPNFESNFDLTDEELTNYVQAAEEDIDNNNKKPAAKECENARFALLSDEDLTSIISSAEAKGTKKNTKWIVSTIEGKYI